MQWLAKQYMNQAVKCAVLLVYCVLLAIGILGAARVKVDTDVSRFIPKDSYLHDWMKVSAEKFGVSGTDSSLYWVHDTKVFVPEQDLIFPGCVLHICSHAHCND